MKPHPLHPLPDPMSSWVLPDGTPRPNRFVRAEMYATLEASTAQAVVEQTARATGSAYLRKFMEARLRAGRLQMLHEIIHYLEAPDATQAIGAPSERTAA